MHAGNNKSSRSLCLSASSIWLALIALIALGINNRAVALPSFAQQTGQPCVTCHVGAFGPQLTPFGRALKLGGYTLEVHH